MVDVNTYLRYAKVAQVKDSTKNANEQFLNGGTLVPSYVRLLYIVRKSVEFMFLSNPSESTLSQTANYMYWLCGKRNLMPTGITNIFLIIVHPQSQSVSSGANVNFTVQATGGTTPYLYQWYYNSNPIGGQTSSSLSLTNVNSGNAGNYYCVVTEDNGSGVSLQSNPAILTVNAATVTVYASAQVSDPFPTLDGGSDPYSYPYNQAITAGANISWNLLNSDNNKFFIFKEPTSQPVKTTWFNTVQNNGSFPDSVMRAPLIIGGFRYYISRIEYAYDISQPTILSV